MTYALAVALALHAALLGALAWRAATPQPPPLATSPALASEEQWLDLVDATPSRPRQVARAAEPVARTPPASGGDTTPGTAPTLRRMASVKLGHPGLEDGDPSSQPAPLPTEPLSPPAPSSPAAPPLSLSELGVGAGNNPFWSLPRSDVPLGRVLNQRVQQMLQSGLGARDRQVGLGPEGAAIPIIERIVRDSPTQPNTSGTLSIRTDERGFTTHVEVLRTDGEAAGWENIARDLRRELSKVALRVPSGSSGVTLQLRVVSRVQLPSGADPGLAFELFGQTLEPGGGERSARISLLSPKVVVTEVEIPYTDGRTMPTVGFSPNVISVSGDLADIGAAAQRVVRAHLVALETHVSPAQ